jgi:threonine dehydrogenase-like Zn-dependent dehydrogenase
VAVVGLGIVGQLAARLHHLAGARVVAADLNPARVAVAVAGGIEAIVPAEGLSAAFKRIQPQGADIVVDSTGVPAVLQQSIQLGKSKAWDDSMTEPTRLVVQGSFPENAVLNYDQAFAREISVYFPRDNQACDIEVILGLFAEGRLKARDLISERGAPADAPRIYSDLRAARPDLLTAVFQWN